MTREGSGSQSNRSGESRHEIEESQEAGNQRDVLRQLSNRNVAHVNERGSSQDSTDEQRSRLEIKPIELRKDINLPRRTKVKDFIRLWVCGVPQKECRLDRLNDVNLTVEQYNNVVRKELQEKLNNIPEELRQPFQSKIDTLVKYFNKRIMIPLTMALKDPGSRENGVRLKLRII